MFECSELKGELCCFKYIPDDCRFENVIFQPFPTTSLWRGKISLLTQRMRIFFLYAPVLLHVFWSNFLLSSGLYCSRTCSSLSALFICSFVTSMYFIFELERITNYANCRPSNPSTLHFYRFVHFQSPPSLRSSFLTLPFSFCFPEFMIILLAFSRTGLTFTILLFMDEFPVDKMKNQWDSNNKLEYDASVTQQL